MLPKRHRKLEIVDLPGTKYERYKAIAGMRIRNYGMKQLEGNLMAYHGLWGYRFPVFERDNYTCCTCGRKANKLLCWVPFKKNSDEIAGNPHLDPYIDNDRGKTILTVDHIIPKAYGGANSHNNLQTMCSPCNRKKGHQLAPDQEYLLTNELQMLLHDSLSGTSGQVKKENVLFVTAHIANFLRARGKYVLIHDGNKIWAGDDPSCMSRVLLQENSTQSIMDIITLLTQLEPTVSISMLQSSGSQDSILTTKQDVILSNGCIIPAEIETSMF